MGKLVRITTRNQTFELEPGLTLLEALEKLGIEPESVLAIRAGEMIAGDCILEEGDEIRLVAVISGGGETRRTTACCGSTRTSC